RSVLVAADQRCPAIIGQAHVLYHGAMGGSRGNIEQALRQLRLEAEDLLKSIADTEAEMSAAPSEFSATASNPCSAGQTLPAPSCRLRIRIDWRCARVPSSGRRESRRTAGRRTILLLQSP